MSKDTEHGFRRSAFVGAEPFYEVTGTVTLTPGTLSDVQSVAWAVGVLVGVMEGLVEEALEWGRFGEPIAWFERFRVATGKEQQELVERIGSYWSDVRVVRVAQGSWTMRTIKTALAQPDVVLPTPFP